MKNFTLYPRLALTGIKKNRRLYIPYILTCIGMVMMFYIMQSLSYSSLIQSMRGGRTVEIVLTLGKYVIAVFSLIFLIYTNSFLARRRNKEFGLYNILGMDKRGIAAVTAWESLFVAVAGLLAGIGLGIAFSKFAELGLLNMLNRNVDYKFRVDAEAIGFTVIIYAVIFVFLFIKSVIQVGRLNPLELFHSENKGEKPPKANPVIAILGTVILGTAYYLAVTIKSPLSALTLYFVAVIMVIIATYMLFTAGSVAVCKLLQKNKGYYYKKNHFVSVSSMAYRMKRNGAGLASICILSTMILVMFSSTASLYFGNEDSLNTLYPYDSIVGVHFTSIDELGNGDIERMREGYYKVFDGYGAEPSNVCEYRYSMMGGLYDGNTFLPADDRYNGAVELEDNYALIFFISADDYYSATGEKVNLEENEALAGEIRGSYKINELSIGDLKFSIVGEPGTVIAFNESATIAVQTLMVVVKDFEAVKSLEMFKFADGSPIMRTSWYYGCDFNADEDTVNDICYDQCSVVQNVMNGNEDGYSYYMSCRYSESADFYSIFGGLFFLGIMLSVVFVFAAVLIIYYKQISEGYEDMQRFEIMQKVGMTKKDIKKSINSQVLTVFFAPLIFAGLHLTFSFPLVWKILQIFNLYNLPLVIFVTVGAFAVFGAFYALVYKITAGSYYRIVSGMADD